VRVVLYHQTNNISKCFFHDAPSDPERKNTQRQTHQSAPTTAGPLTKPATSHPYLNWITTADFPRTDPPRLSPSMPREIYCLSSSPRTFAVNFGPSNDCPKITTPICRVRLIPGGRIMFESCRIRLIFSWRISWTRLISRMLIILCRG
jgi:hypothetical protein